MIWGSTCSIHLKAAEILQKKIIRIISGVNPRTHSLPLFENMKILTVKEVFYYSVTMFMYKFERGQLPNIFDKFFIHPYEIHDHDTRYKLLFRTPFCKTGRSQHTICFYGPKIWNFGSF